MGLDVENIIRVLYELRSKDPSYDEILGAMITKPPDYLVKAYEVFIDTNINDPWLFKTAYSLGREAVDWFSRLFHGKGPGVLTYGGSESNLTALYILREVRRGRYVVAPKTAHISIKKACRVLGLQLI